MQSVSVTIKALEHIKKMLKKQGAGIGMRLAVKDSGCTGKKYVVDIITDKNSDDHVYDIGENLILCVDPKTHFYVAGTTIDYERKGIMGGALVFHNPNVKAACGCGESFNV